MASDGLEKTTRVAGKLWCDFLFPDILFPTLANTRKPKLSESPSLVSAQNKFYTIICVYEGSIFSYWNQWHGSSEQGQTFGNLQPGFFPSSLSPSYLSSGRTCNTTKQAYSTSWWPDNLNFATAGHTLYIFLFLQSYSPSKAAIPTRLCSVTLAWRALSKLFF